jgi:hypothetical protein
MVVELLVVACAEAHPTGLAGLGGFAAAFGIEGEEVISAGDDVFGDDVLAALLLFGEGVHEVEHEFFADGAECSGAGVTFEGFFGNGVECVWGELEFGAFHAEELLVLLDEGVLRLGEDGDEDVGIEGVEGCEEWETADELGDHAELDEVFGLALAEDASAFGGGLEVLFFGAEADLSFAEAFADDVFESDEGSAADEEDLGGVHLDVLLFGVFSSALWGDVGDGSFEHLEEGLLDAFAGDVAGDGDVVLGFADLIDFIDVDDSALCGFEVVVGVLEEAEEDVFDVFADVSGFGECGGVADGKGDVEGFGEGSCEEGFAGACGSDKEDVGLIDFDDVVGFGLFAEGEAFVVVVDGDGEGFFCVVLADDVLVEEFLDLSWRGDGGEERLGAGEFAFFLSDDVVCEVNAVGADVDVGGTFDHRSDVAGGFTAEGAGGHASASETAWGIIGTGVVGRVIGAAAVAGAIGTGHRVAFL